MITQTVTCDVCKLPVADGRTLVKVRRNGESWDLCSSKCEAQKHGELAAAATARATAPAPAAPAVAAPAVAPAVKAG